MFSRGILILAAATILGIIMAPFVQPPWIFTLILIPVCAVLYMIRPTQYFSWSLLTIATIYGLGYISLFAFLSSIAIVAFGEIAATLYGGKKYEYLVYVISALISSFLVLLYLVSFNTSILYLLQYNTPLVILLGVLVAALLRVVLKRREDRLMITFLGVAMTMALFTDIGLYVEVSKFLLAAIISLLFGYTAYKIRAADMSGLFSGAIVGIILIVFAGVNWFFVMLAFFIIGSATTRYRFAYKVSIGVEQSRTGVRGYINVFANGMVSVAAAVLYGIYGDPIYAAVFLGSVCTAAGDTAASEVGVTGKTPLMITTLKPVPVGTDGGVTITGELASFLASGAVALVALMLGVAATPLVAFIAAVAGFVGTNVDSLVGATMETKGRIGNAGTNLIATFSGGLFAMISFMIFMT